ncbi:hypothetical protein ACFQH2_13500 [Natronoarchaeum sp. GCM10025703]|uniref:hypothetical protein n=1 Tax=Natronoarchaeum sp. GCM10025703 TaxID=3252685 RepID=UPI00360EA750
MIGRRLSRTATAMRAALTRPGPLLLAVAVGVAYLLGYLYAIGDLVVREGVGVGVAMPVADPLTHMLGRTGPVSFEAIAIVDLEPLRLLFSPLNTLLGVGLAVLVGINIAMSYLAVTQPRSCGLGATSGVLASVPALLSGSACCAPVVLLVLGIQASGLLLTALTWLLPVGIVLLIGSLVYLGGESIRHRRELRRFPPAVIEG